MAEWGAHLGLRGAVTVRPSSKGLGLLHLCVTLGRFVLQVGERPAVLSCGSSGDSLENVKPRMWRPQKPLFTVILKPEIKTLYNFRNTYVAVI